jgi:uncharacterized protein
MKINKLSFVTYLPELIRSSNREHCWPKQARSLAAVSLGRLMDESIQGIIIALDNTIISEDDRYVSPYAITWIALAKQLGFKLFILSDSNRERVTYWSEYLQIPAIDAVRKPYPTAFRTAMTAMQLTPDRVVVIGNSILTDLFGARLIGCPHIQVASLPHPPKWWEKLIGKYVQITYPSGYELWDFRSSSYIDNN